VTAGPKVLFVVLDGVSPRHVNETVMPGLTARAHAGGWCRAGIPGVMPTSTYPNHATFVTGVVPAEHGIVANEIPTSAGAVPSWDRGPSVPTLFDSSRAAGRRSAAVFGDDHLVGVTGARDAGYLWPRGRFGDGVATDILGYAKDRETTARIRAAIEAGAELIVAQLNETDTAGHLFGPDSPEAHDRYRRADAYLAGVLEWLGDQWEEWVVIVVSDHSQEAVTEPCPIDLRSFATRAGVMGVVVDDGAVAVLGGPMARDPAWITEVAGVEGVTRIDGDTVLAWADGGRWFSSVQFPVRGVHGSPRTAPQVAVVTGGHPATGPLAVALEGCPASSTWWAPTIAGLMGITPPAELTNVGPGAGGGPGPPESAGSAGHPAR
jgi:hypothetical protein